METPLTSANVLQLSKQIASIAKELEELEKLRPKLKDLEEENKSVLSTCKKYKTKHNEIVRENNNLLIKNGNLQKRIDRYEEIYSNIPGTTREDKYRLLLFITEEILPWIIESANSRTYKKIVEFWNYFLKKEKSNKKKYTGGYYVYSHTIIGEKFPFYIGFSRNNDGQYNRSKEFANRHETWHEYVSARGDKTNIDVNIIGEIKTEEAAIELEKFYIRHYTENVVNIIKN
jgi:regulator of replication initiation timing